MRALGIVGTSIADGTGAPLGESYPVVAAKAARLPYVVLGKGGESLDILNTAANHLVRYGVLKGLCTDVYSEHGVNDLGQTFATFMSRYATEWTALAALGLRVWQGTILPSYNSSSDGWLTVGGQTPASNNSVRVLVNDWMRDGAPWQSGAPVATGTSGAARCDVYDQTGALATAASGPAGHPLAGVFEIADTCESRNSGIWKADGTSAGRFSTDGVHPNPSSTTQVTLMAAAINTTAIAADPVVSVVGSSSGLYRLVGGVATPQALYRWNGAALVPQTLVH